MFLRLSKAKRHTHIAYLNEQAGTGRTSEADGHSHLISYREQSEAVIDPITQQVLADATTGGWYVEPVNNHTHDLTTETVEGTDKKAGGKDDEIVSRVKALYKIAKEDEEASRKLAEESENFYRGEQWAKEDRTTLESEQRPALTFNEVESKIDLLSGYQRQNRYDMRYLPVEGGDSRIADILTEIVKNVHEQCNFDFEETVVFEDELIAGRGVFNAYIDYDDDIQGTIKTERFPWQDVFIGPHEKADLSDCEHVHKARWFSKAKVKQLWPDKADKVDTYFADLTTKDLHGYPAGKNYDHPESEVPSIGGADPDFVNIAKKEIRVIECIYKEYDSVTVFAIPETEEYIPATGWKSADIAAVKTIQGVQAIPRKITRFRVSIVGGNTLLDDYYSDLDDFNLVPVYAKKRGSHWWGKIESVKDPQREINKRRSQMADATNRQNGYGWFYDDQTFPDPKAERKFKENAAKPGFMQKVTDMSRLPAKVEGMRFPVELVNSIALDSQKIREIMNVNLEMGGGTSNATSGIAIAERKRQGLVGNEFLFDNMSLAKRRLGRIYIKFIQKIYTPERIMRIIANRMDRQEIQMGGQKYGPQNPMPVEDMRSIMDLLNTADLGKYDVVVGESAFSPTAKLANFAMFLELAGKGMPIPPQLLIQLSPLPEKEKQEALQAIQQQMDMQAQQEKQKYDTELQKVALSKGGATPMPQQPQDLQPPLPI